MLYGTDNSLRNIAIVRVRSLDGKPLVFVRLSSSSSVFSLSFFFLLFIAYFDSQSKREENNNISKSNYGHQHIYRV